MHLHLARNHATPLTINTHHAAAIFGLDPHQPRSQTIIPPCDITLRPGQLIYITGPSGSGKSSLLRLIRRRLRNDRTPCITLASLAPKPRHRQRAIVDCFTTESLQLSRATDPPLPDILRWLSHAGLADAFTFLRTPAQLSEGQHHRLALARAFAFAELTKPSANEPDISRQHQQEPPGHQPDLVILADEFASTLDRLTARILARSARRFIDRHPQLCFIAATSHDDLLHPLRPDLLIHKPLDNTIHIHPRLTHSSPPKPSDHDPGSPISVPINNPPEPAHNITDPTFHSLGLRFTIQPGTIDDYRALAAHHYRAAAPATIARILRITADEVTVTDRFLHRPAPPQLAAVLLESMPVLQLPARDLALADRYRHLPDAASRGRLLADEIRCISRVIVHPRYRALGLATRLTQRALHTATTRFTEALAAMGRVHPFFERAGMTAFPLPPHRDDQRLLDLLAQLGLDPLTPIHPHHLDALDGPQRRLLARELQRWTANRQRPGRRQPQTPAITDDSAHSPAAATRARDNHAPPALAHHLRRAQIRMLHQPLYYLHDNHRHHDNQPAITKPT